MPLAVDFQGGVTSAWSNVITFVPKLAAALLIILVGYLLAKVVASVLDKVLERVGFDRAVERGGIKQALAKKQVRPLRHRRQAGLLAHLPGQPADRLRGVRPQPDQRPAPGPDRLSAQRVGGHRDHRGRRGHRQGSHRPAVQPALQRVRRPGHGQGAPGSRCWSLGPSPPGPAADRPPDRDRPVVRDLAIVVGSAVVAIGGGGIKTMQRYWERATTKAEERAPQLSPAGPAAQPSR